MSALSDLLNEARGDLSVRAVGRKVAEYGVGESTIIPYFNGKHGTPSVPVLEALTKVLPVSIGQLYTAVGLPAGEGKPYEPPAEATMLTRRQRLAIDELIRSFVDTRGATHAEPSATADHPPAEAAGAQGTEKQKTKPAGLSGQDQASNVKPLRRRGRDFTADPVIEPGVAAYDPDEPTDDERRGGEDERGE